MKLWEFDRVGGIASALFDMNKDCFRVASVVLAIFSGWTRSGLRFDPRLRQISRGGGSLFNQFRLILGRSY